LSEQIDFPDDMKIAKSLVDPSIKLPDKIENLEGLGNALKEDISFYDI
jgi:hypothetical protein